MTKKREKAEQTKMDADVERKMKGRKRLNTENRLGKEECLRGERLHERKGTQQTRTKERKENVPR